MLTYPMEERGSLPLYEYLCRSIRSDILSGALPAGTRLPSKRALAEHLRVSVITVEGAYSQLEAEGYLQARPKRGFFVSAVERPLPAAEEPPAAVPLEPQSPQARLDLSRNRVDTARFPVSTWAKLTRQVLSEAPEALLSPVPHQGLPALRQAIADELRDLKGMAVSPSQIIIGAGAEYLYLLLAQLLGRDTAFAVEDPGYPKIRQVYRACGAACVPIPLDGQGIDPAALAASGADLVILDIMMPFVDGMTCLREMRKRKIDTPVIMLTARGEEYDKLAGLEGGADDYVVKPFSPRELVARVKVVLARTMPKTQEGGESFVFGDLVIDTASHSVKIAGEEAPLTPKEFDLLVFLVSNKGLALSREKILQKVWNYDYYGEDRTVDTHVKMLRSHLGKYRDNIVTVWGIGYKFDPDVRPGK